VVLAICTFGVKAFNLWVICSRFLFSDSDVALSFLERIAVFDIHRERFAYTAVYFFIGGIAYRYEREIMKISAAKRNAIAALGLLLFSSLLFIIGILCSRALGYIWDIVWCGYDTLFTCAGLICLYILSLSVRGERRFVTAVSKNTIGIYFIHPILISFLLPWLIKLEWMRNMPMNILAATLVLLASFGLCVALSKIPIFSKLVK
jgi:surface polysaccharide O-acyltransferase-like enzyme